MAQSSQIHTLIIRIAQDNSNVPPLCDIDQVMVVDGKITQSHKSAPEIHFDCLHCQSRYFISPVFINKPQKVIISNETQLTEVMVDIGVDEPGNPEEIPAFDHSEAYQSTEIEMVDIPVKNEVISQFTNEDPQGSDLSAILSEDFIQRSTKIAEEYRSRANEDPIQINYTNLQPSIPLDTANSELKIAGEISQRRRKYRKWKKPNIYQCDICNIVFKFHCQLKRHWMVHSNKRSFTCEICGAAIKHRANVKAHMNKHLGFQYPCPQPQCTKTFTYKRHLKAHCMSMHQIEIKPEFLFCDICNASFESKVMLMRHMNTHLKTPNKSKSPKPSINVQSLREDQLDVHQKDQKKDKGSQNQNSEISFFKCDICGASIKLKDSLVRHMNTHLGHRYKCTECQMTFAHEGGFIHHKNRMHKSEFRFCKLCNWGQMSTKAEYFSHLRRGHPDYRFQNHQEATKRVGDFNGVDFPCIYCEPEKVFTSFNQLINHHAAVHGRQYSCTRCPKGLTTRYILEAHIEAVHEKKTYECEKCNKKFTQVRHFRKHLLNH